MSLHLLATLSTANESSTNLNTSDVSERGKVSSDRLRLVSNLSLSVLVTELVTAMTPQSLTTFLLSLLVILTQATGSFGLVVSAPGIPIDSLVETPSRRQDESTSSTTLPPLTIRVRSTIEKDLPEIATLLASASVNDEAQWNWKTSMQVLKNKSSYQKLLSSRLQAMRAGQRAAKRIDSFDNEALNTHDKMRLLWNDDSFRHHVEKAATLAKEPHLWHNVVVMNSQHAKALQHAMITAEDVATGSVVGFCEVAMLALPSEGDCECLPTIANLATSTKHRRQGIASSLLNSARTYVQRHLSSNKIALYVQESNKGAVALYSKHGFKCDGHNVAKGGQLYMTKSIQPSTRRKEAIVL